MIIGTGCDIVEHNTTEALNWESDMEVLNRIFSNKELDQYAIQKTTRFLAGRFAAKEAILKCLGTGMQDGISLKEIQILQTDNGKPIVDLSGGVKEISETMQIKLWHISITHSKEFSMAFAIAEI